MRALHSLHSIPVSHLQVALWKFIESLNGLDGKGCNSQLEEIISVSQVEKYLKLTS